MLRIPYLPTAYPDEMLASLLTRLMLYNGSGLWRSLLEDSGYGRRTISPFFSTPVQDINLERLLATLGYTYPQMLRELTVLPFWLSFNQATAVRSRISVGAKNCRNTNLRTLGRTQFLPGARYCPSCLRDDIKTYGEPYLHRSHQLPVASVCTRHGMVLRFACPACRITVIPFNRALLRPPALQCECGEDLSRSAEPPPAHLQAMLRLSEFAADALSCAEAPWTQRQVLTVLHERTGNAHANFKQLAMRLMQDAYGPPEKPRSGKSNIRTWEYAGLPMHLNMGASPISLRAPEFCALLAAARLSFEEFIKAVSQVEVSATPAKSVSLPRPISLEQARQDYLRFEVESPGRAGRRLEATSLSLYWLLRLGDSAFLRAHGYRNHLPVPTIMSDREKIEELLRRHGGRLPPKCGAHIRASIRDLAWLQSQVKAHAAIAVPVQTPAQRTQQERAMALSRAVFSVLRTQARPARVHAGTLAKFAQISMHQAQHTISHTPALSTLIAAVNASKSRRLAFWAARSLIEEGKNPSAYEVLLRAKLVTTRVNRKFCNDAIASLAYSITDKHLSPAS